MQIGRQAVWFVVLAAASARRAVPACISAHIVFSLSVCWSTEHLVVDTDGCDESTLFFLSGSFHVFDQPYYLRSILSHQSLINCSYYGKGSGRLDVAEQSSEYNYLRPSPPQQSTLRPGRNPPAYPPKKTRDSKTVHIINQSNRTCGLSAFHVSPQPGPRRGRCCKRLKP